MAKNEILDHVEILVSSPAGPPPISNGSEVMNLVSDHNNYNGHIPLKFEWPTISLALIIKKSSH